MAGEGHLGRVRGHLGAEVGHMLTVHMMAVGHMEAAAHMMVVAHIDLAGRTTGVAGYLLGYTDLFKLIYNETAREVDRPCPYSLHDPYPCLCHLTVAL